MKFSSGQPLRRAVSIMLVGLSLSFTACTNLSYPGSETEPSGAGAITSTGSTDSAASTATGAPSAVERSAPNAGRAAAEAPSSTTSIPTPTLTSNSNSSSQYGIPETLPPDPSDETLEWHDLTRLSREHRLRGEFAEANTRLAQAALQLSSLRPGNASRRAVFSQRARLARELFVTGESEAGELLADELFTEAETDPAIGGTSLIDLARDTIERRAEAPEFDFSEEEELRLLALAFHSSQTGTATRARVNLGFEVASLALHLDQIELAREAIDQSVLDARTTNPLDLDQEASLKIYKSRIALAQGDIQTAEAAATGAKRMLESIDANASSSGVAEATLADVLTVKGETDLALELARTGYARNQDEKLYEHALRTIIGSLARAEAAAGLTEDARRHYREALAIPVEDSALDERLDASIRRRFDALKN